MSRTQVVELDHDLQSRIYNQIVNMDDTIRNVLLEGAERYANNTITGPKLRNFYKAVTNYDLKSGPETNFMMNVLLENTPDNSPYKSALLNYCKATNGIGFVLGRDLSLLRKSFRYNGAAEKV